MHYGSYREKLYTFKTSIMRKVKSIMDKEIPESMLGKFLRICNLGLLEREQFVHQLALKFTCV